MLISFQHSTRKRDHVHINPFPALHYGCPFYCDSTVFNSGLPLNYFALLINNETLTTFV